MTACDATETPAERAAAPRTARYADDATETPAERAAAIAELRILARQQHFRRLADANAAAGRRAAATLMREAVHRVTDRSTDAATFPRITRGRRAGPGAAMTPDRWREQMAARDELRRLIGAEIARGRTIARAREIVYAAHPELLAQAGEGRAA
jgi:hypothetical protein